MSSALLFIESLRIVFYSLIMKKQVKQVIKQPEHQVLTMDHLEVGFIACLIPLALSVVVFLIEISMIRIKSALLTISGYLTAIYVVKVYTRVDRRGY